MWPVQIWYGAFMPLWWNRQTPQTYTNLSTKIRKFLVNVP